MQSFLLGKLPLYLPFKIIPSANWNANRLDFDCPFSMSSSFELKTKKLIKPLLITLVLSGANLLETSDCFKGFSMQITVLNLRVSLLFGHLPLYLRPIFFSFSFTRSHVHSFGLVWFGTWMRARSPSSKCYAGKKERWCATPCGTVCCWWWEKDLFFFFSLYFIFVHNWLYLRFFYSHIRN